MTGLFRFRHPAVRDLAWALTSPPLLALVSVDSGRVGPAGFRPSLTDCLARLERLDRDPAPLLEALGEARDGRLGGYFEDLWAFWLSDHPRYRILERRLPVRNGGRTLGELDLLVHDRATGRCLHWELAVKFYLGTGTTRDPGCWFGPNRRDRLDIKVTRLAEHQMRLPRRPAARRLLDAKGLPVAGSRAVVKGRLFYPASGCSDAPGPAHPDHLRGLWYDADAFQAEFEGRPLRWHPLPKSAWLAPRRARELSPLLNTPDLIAGINPENGTYPTCVAAFDGPREAWRAFIVPPGWAGAG